MTPYYQDDAVTIYHGDSRTLLHEFADQSMDAVITDPPYTERTHSGMRVNVGRTAKRVELFDSIGEDDLEGLLAECGRITRRWVVSSLAYQHAFRFDETPPAGLRSLRVGVWVKPNPMPQVSGDRPGQGWEALSFMHRADVRPAWNGGGRSGVWHARAGQGEGHPTVKPLGMLADFVRLFTNPGDVVLDPFAGTGTTLRAAKDEGRRGVGIELEEKYCELAARRLSQDSLFGAV